MYRVRKVIALIIGCEIVVASWIIGCRPSTQPEGNQNEGLPREIGSDKDLSKMVLIPKGEFYMGTSNSSAQKIAESYQVLFWEDELPRHLVELEDDYYIDKYEVTNSQYKEFLDANPNYGKPKYWRNPKFRQPYQPVVGVTWEDARAYCGWMSQQIGVEYRLPTEAEWERAVAGTSTENILGNMYPWGNEFDENRLNFDFRIDRPISVKSFPNGATASGVMNMAGNAAEWVYDWYAPDYYAKSPPENPTGPSTGTDRVYRGGCWNDWRIKHFGVRCTKRYHAPPDTASVSIGFRCAMDATPENISGYSERYGD